MTAAWSGALLLIAAAIYVLASVLMSVQVVTVAVVVALLLTALVQPVHDALRALRLPRALAALVTLVGLLGVLALAVTFVWNRAAAQFGSLQSNVAQGLHEVRDWLVNGPLSLRSGQIDRLQSELTGLVWSSDDPSQDLVVGAQVALEALGALVLVLS